MWHTANGDRTLFGAESQLIRNVVGELIDAIRADPELGIPPEYGIERFDELDWRQQMVMLLRVVRGLLDENVPPIELTALNESVVAAIYAQMRAGVEVELDADGTLQGDDAGDRRRAEIVAALHDRRPDSLLPSSQSVVMENWTAAIDCLEDMVLGDHDWALPDLLLDASPDYSRETKQKLGLGDGYFMDTPPDATDDDARLACADLLELVYGVRPDSATIDRIGRS